MRHQSVKIHTLTYWGMAADGHMTRTDTAYWPQGSYFCNVAGDVLMSLVRLGGRRPKVGERVELLNLVLRVAHYDPLRDWYNVVQDGAVGWLLFLLAQLWYFWDERMTPAILFRLHWMGLGHYDATCAMAWRDVYAVAWLIKQIHRLRAFLHEVADELVKWIVWFLTN